MLREQSIGDVAPKMGTPFPLPAQHRRRRVDDPPALRAALGRGAKIVAAFNTPAHRRALLAAEPAAIDNRENQQQPHPEEISSTKHQISNKFKIPIKKIRNGNSAVLNFEMFGALNIVWDLVLVIWCFPF